MQKFTYTLEFHQITASTLIQQFLFPQGWKTAHPSLTANGFRYLPGGFVLDFTLANYYIVRLKYAYGARLKSVDKSPY